MSQGESPAAIETAGGISSEAVRAKTGRGWSDWVAILDEAGAESMTHPQIARYLGEQQGVADWWCQMVTVGYEQVKGRRVKHEKSDGYAGSASKTVSVSLATLYAAWADSARRELWLPDQPFTVRKATPEKSMRLGWADGSRANIYFTGKGDTRSQVAVEHEKLTSLERVAEIKQWWRDALDRLASQLTG